MTNVCITGRSGVGAVVGRLQSSTIIDCSSTGEIDGFSAVGGVAGNMYDVTMDSCTSSAVIGFIALNGSSVGGLIGIASSSMISNCSTVCDLTHDTLIGGLIGRSNQSAIHACCSTGTVQGNVEVGGLIGEMYGGGLTDCWSTATVTGQYFIAGGLVGRADNANLTNCYFQGEVTCNESAGGLVGAYRRITLNNSHYGINHVHINGEHRYGLGVLAGGMFQDWYDNNLSLDINDYLNTSTNGDVLIDGFEELFTMLAFCHTGEYTFRLTGDIDLLQHPGFFIPYFSGEFDGDGYEIANLMLETPDPYEISLGLFGFTHATRITDLTASNIDFSGYSRIGGLISYADGGTILDNCHVTGVINAVDGFAGGLISECDGQLDVLNCSFAGTVSSHHLLGSNGGVISVSSGPSSFVNSYAQGTVINGGGFANQLTDSNLIDCYSEMQVLGSGAGFVVDVGSSMITDCYSTGDVQVDGSRPSSGFANSVHDESIINNCYCTGDIVNGLAGFIGCISTSVVDSCYCVGDVIGVGGYVGGFVGSCFNSQVTDCSCIGDVVSNLRAGGFVGESIGAVISRCFCLGSVEGSYSAGGFVGVNVCNETVIENCYARGDVVNGGGFVGENSSDASIVNCYCTGNVTNGLGFANENTDDAVITNSFWNTETSGCLLSAGGTGKTTAEMHDVATYTSLATIGLDEPWDFVGDPFDDTGDEDIWVIDPAINDGYPYFNDEPVGVDDDETIPAPESAIALSPAFPNPFNPTTTIAFSIAAGERATLEIFNVRGQRVRIFGDYPAGEHSVVWSGSDDNGSPVASGVYFYRLYSDRDSQVRKMLLMK